jgi:hypothetical protein
MKIKVRPTGYLYISKSTIDEMRKRRLSTIANINSLFEVKVERGDDEVLVTFDDRSKGSSRKIRNGMIQLWVDGVFKKLSCVNADVNEIGDLVISRG